MNLLMRFQFMYYVRFGIADAFLCPCFFVSSTFKLTPWVLIHCFPNADFSNVEPVALQSSHLKLIYGCGFLKMSSGVLIPHLHLCSRSTAHSAVGPQLMQYFMRWIRLHIFVSGRIINSKYRAEVK